MRKIIFAVLTFMVTLALPESLFAQASKNAADCPEIWMKKVKNFDKKEVSTFVAEIGRCGLAKSDADFAVVPVETATNAKKEGGLLYVLIPPEQLPNFESQFLPQIEKGGSAFGSKSVLKKISGTFVAHKSEPVLLWKIDLKKLEKKGKISEILDAQIAFEDEQTGANVSTKAGYEKKFFSVSRMGKNSAAKREFKRLLALYNKDKKGKEKLRESDALLKIKEDGESLTCFEDAKKIEWEIRK